MTRSSDSRKRPSRPGRLRRRRLWLEWLEDRAVPANLTLSLADPAIVEGNVTTATVTRDGDLSQPLLVWLDSSDATEVSVQPTVEIQAGQPSANFPVGAIDDTDQDGVQTIHVLAWDNLGGNGNATLKVLDNDSPPSVQPDRYDAGEDETLTVSGFGVLANDSSLNVDLTASLVSGPSHGTLSLAPGGGFTYRPDANYNGPDSFIYRATDPAGLSGQATVSLTVWEMNDPLLLDVPGPQTTAEDTPLTFSAANGNAITITDVDNPRVMVALLATPGILTLRSTDGLEFPYPGETNNSNAITFYADNPAEANAALEGLIYTPAADQNGITHLSILVQDMSLVSPTPSYASGDIPITITPVNDAPVAGNDTLWETNEDTNLTIPDRGVLVNDSDIDGDPLTAVLVSGPANGAVTLRPGGGFTYTPNPNFFGTDTFTYRATDPGGLSGVATVTIKVWAVDDPIQVAVPGSQSTVEDTPLSFGTAAGNAITIIDPESPPVQVSISVAGTLTLATTDGITFPEPNAGNNSPWIIFNAPNPAVANAALNGLVFTPFPDMTSTVRLMIQVQDLSMAPFWVAGNGEVEINIVPVNDAPVAMPDGPYTVEAGEPLVTSPGGGGGPPGVLANDSDVDLDALIAVLVSGPSHGSLTLNPDGTFTYVSDPTYSGRDAFTYRASDGQLLSNPVEVVINVTPRNWPPVGGGDSYTVDEDGTLSVGAPGVLANDSDAEGQPLTARFFSGTAHGSLTLRADGSFTYTPAANYNGPDEFWYQPYDGVKYGQPTRVAVTVNSVNDVPVAVNDAYALDEDTPLTVAAAGVLANDSDADGDALAASVVTGPGHGTLNLNADGSFTYTPAANYNGPDSFTYRAVDPSGAESVATVSLTVRPVNDAPVAGDDAYTTTEDIPFSATVPGVTSVTMVSDAGDYIGQGRTYNLTPQTGTFTISRNYDNGVSLRYSSATEWWNWDFAAANEGLLVPGLYANATRFPFQAAGVPGLSVSGDGRGSNTLTGWFRIDEIAYGPAGEVLVFAATFEQHSEGATPALRGTIRYNAGSTTPGGVLLNDSDAEGSPLTASLVAAPAHGQLFLNPNGTFLYVPAANFAGVDSFRYKVSDGSLDSNVATATITVAAVNDAPVNTVPGTQTIVEDTTLTFSTAAGNAIRVNDVDAGTSLIELRLSAVGFLTFPTTTGLTFVTGSNGGNLITVRGTVADLNAALDGLVFRPAANANGSYYVQVTTNDLGNTGSGGALSDMDLAMVTITPVNDAPQNVVPLITPVTAEDTALTFNPPIWVTDPDQTTGAATAPVRVTLEVASGGGILTVTPGAGVTLTGNGTGQVVFVGMIQSINNVLRTLTFSPPADANDLTAPVQIRMTTDDQANGGPGALTDTDTFSITVNPVNDAPQMTLSGTSVTVPMNSGAYSGPGFASSVAGPATATDELAGQTLAYEVQVTGTTGSLSFAAVPAVAVNGTLSFTPAAGTWGTATLRVLVRDSGGTAGGGVDVSPYQTFTIAVTNTPPTSSGLPPVSVLEDAPPTAITLTDYFADQEDGAAGLTYAVVGNDNPGLFTSVSVASGVLTLNYAPNANGSAALTVRATDSGGLSVAVPLAVTVTAVNDAPTSTELSPVTVDEDAVPTSITLTDSFADVEDGPAGLTYSVVGNTNPGMFGSVSVVSGVLTLNYAANAYGSATLTVRATDSGGLFVEAPIAVTVNPVNDAPTASGLAPVAVNEDAAPTAVTLTGSFGDVEDGPAGLVYSVVGNTNPALFGSVSVAGGVLTLSYAPNANGAATLTVRATDSGGLWVESPLTVTVAAVNDAPTFTAGTNATVASDAGPQTLSGWATGMSPGPADESGQTLTFEVWADDPLLFAVQPAIDPVTGTLTFTPVNGAAGTATITVVLRDNGGGADASAPATFTITLTAPALPPGVQINGTELVITGGAGNDSITLATVSGGNGSNGVKITGNLNGQAINKTYKQTFTSIRISTDGGNDTVKIADGITLPTIVDAGAGDDSVKGGGGADLLFGGAGKDTIDSAAGDDNVDAGAGNDSVVGGLGRDVLLGGTGDDTVQGGDGNDFLIGGLGADLLSGQNGDDILVAGLAAVRNPATDSLRQVIADWDPSVAGIHDSLRVRLSVTDDPTAIDNLQGNAGTDWFWSSDPLDVLDLGPGEQRN